MRRQALLVCCALSLAVACNETKNLSSTQPAVSAKSSGVERWSAPTALPFDVQQVVRDVQHSWQGLEVNDLRYQAALQGGELRFLAGRSVAGRVERAARPFVVRTERVSFGRKTIYASPRPGGEFRVTRSRAERRLVPGLRETFEASEGRVEQSWVIEELRDRGELTIDLRISGLPWAGADEGGHLFRETGSEVGVSYGLATAKDARGVGVTVRPERIPGGLRIRVPERFMAQAKAPLLVDPTIGSEFGMDGSLPRNSAEDQTYVRAACSGSQYLLVWQDYRVLDSRYHIYGARVSAAGVLLDPTGIEISTSPNSHAAPDVAYDGTNFFVVWEESGSSPSTSGWDIYGTRVNASGSVLNAGGIKIGGGSGDQRAPRIAFGGNQHLVIWQHTGTGATGTDVRGARVDTTGGLLDATPIAIATGAGDQTTPDVAANGSTFLAVWRDSRNSAATGEDIYGARVTAAGTVSEPSGIAITTAAGTQRAPAVASNGTNWLVAWDDGRDYAITFYDMYASRVASDGTVQDASGIKVSGLGGDEISARIASDGTDYFVIWSDATVIAGNYAGRWVKGTSGATPGSQGFQVFVNGYNDLVYNSSSGQFFVPRHGSSNALGHDVFARRVQADGTAIDGADLAVSMGYNAQYYPAVAFDGTNYLVVWSDSRNWATSGWDIYGVRVSAAGMVQDANGLVVCNANGTQSYPDVAFDGTNYFVVWEDRRPGSSVADVFGGRMTKDGALLDGQGFQLSGQIYEQRYPRVAFDNMGTYLVVWQDNRNSVATPGRGYDIFGTRVRATDGFVYEQLSGIQISSQQAAETDPAVAFDGTNFVVVWSDGRAGTSNFDIYGARLNMGGTVLDPAGIAISTANGHQYYPDIVFTGTQYLVVWQDARTSGNSYDIYGTYLSTQMVPASSSGLAIHAGTADQTRPRVEMVGKAPLVVWEDRSSFDAASYNLRGARLGASTVLESFVLSADPRNEIRPVAAAGSGNQGLAAYMHYDTALKTVRVVARTYLETCSSSSQCPPGSYCSAGKCITCNTDEACGPSCTPCTAGNFCDGTSCKPCTTSAHCGPSCVDCGSVLPFCTGTACVECLTENDCVYGKFCVKNACVAPDSGTPDLAVPDQTIVDLTPPKEAAAPEGPVADISPAQPEASTPDAAKEASLPDAHADSASPDKSSAREGGARPEAGAPDLPSADQGQIVVSGGSGCDCQVGRSSSSSGLLLLLGLALVGIRRRRVS